MGTPASCCSHLRPIDFSTIFQFVTKFAASVDSLRPLDWAENRGRPKRSARGHCKSFWRKKTARHLSSDNCHQPDLARCSRQRSKPLLPRLAARSVQSVDSAFSPPVRLLVGCQPHRKIDRSRDVRQTFSGRKSIAVRIVRDVPSKFDRRSHAAEAVPRSFFDVVSSPRKAQVANGRFMTHRCG